MPSSSYEMQLRQSLNTIHWIVAQFPQEQLTTEPPPNLTEWAVQRHIYHLWVYEHYVTVMMRSWFMDAVLPTDDQVKEFDTLWQHQAAEWDTLPFEETMGKFAAIREEQISLVSRYSADEWQRKMPMVWGEVTLKWTVTKTIQHAMEHSDTLMKLLLWWQ